MQEFITVVLATIKAVADGLSARIEALERRPVPKDGTNGKDGEKGADGKDSDPLLIAALKEELIELRAEVKMLKAVPALSLDDLRPSIIGEVAKALSEMPRAKDGKDGLSVDAEAVASLVYAKVEGVVQAWALPKDGKSVTVDDVAPLVAAEVTKAVQALPVPKDGVGMLGALIDRNGHLVVTLSDGTVQALGPVVGKDVDMADVMRRVLEAVAQIPRPKDGIDGLNGLGFDDLQAAYDEQGRLSLKFVRGEQLIMIPVPCFTHLGVWKDGVSYRAGDGVAWGGSFWIAHEDTTAKPGETNAASRAWRLAAQRGRDGTQGPKGENGINGKDGRPGRDGNKTW